VGAALCAGVWEVLAVDRVGAADELVDLADDDPADEVVEVEEVVERDAELDPSPDVSVGSVGVLSDVEVAGAVVVGEDGVVGVVSVCEDTFVSSLRVVPVDEECPTSADTGFWLISSIPVTMPMATTKTATA
jgi:hypothetical protein